MPHLDYVGKFSNHTLVSKSTIEKSANKLFFSTRVPVSSQQLVELFQAQVAPNPELPPALIPDYSAGASVGFDPERTDSDSDGDGDAGAEGEVPAAGAGARFERGAVDVGGGRARLVRMRRYQLNSPSAPPPFASLHAGTPAAGAPAPPRFDRSLFLRGELTVPRAGYSEPYTVW